MEPTDLRDDLLNAAAARASVDGIFTADAFMEELGQLLVDAGELDHVDRLSFTGTGRKRQGLAVHGSCFDDRDRTVSLIVLRFTGGDEAPTMNFTEASAALKTLENYLREAVSGDFLVDREPSSPEYQLAQLLNEWTKAGTKSPLDAVNRFRLYLVTDAVLSTRAKAIPASSVEDIPVEFHIWDMSRFFQVHESAQGREPLELTLSEWGIDGIPALRVDGGPSEVATYLAAVPGSLLADLYRHHGNRLLEGNVRSFLTIRGKINKGIRSTITKEPTRFLAYNNGISATASSVEYDNGALSQITDLQIVNGGQTTASLFYATQAERDLDLSSVFVQMKLVVVAPDEAATMVPLISRYANSQNAVREDDFFSNSPFHVRMEEISKRLLAPPTPGVNYQTKWYYERTRGQYLNERNRKSGASLKQFDAQYPRAQVITKTDAAKYVVSWERQPHLVSGGAQKNFIAFAKLVADNFVKDPQQFTENYFRRLVAKAILFQNIRSAISKADWYQPGYLANITSYAIAKLSYEMSRDSRVKDFDLLRIWDAQTVGPAMLAEAVELARMASSVLTDDDRNVVNVTEWAKREAAWYRLRDRPYSFGDEFIIECLPKKLTASGEKAVTVMSYFDPSISERRHVQKINGSVWREVRTFLDSKQLLSPTDRRHLQQVIPTSLGFVPLDSARALLGLYVKALNNGWQSGE